MVTGSLNVSGLFCSFLVGCSMAFSSHCADCQWSVVTGRLTRRDGNPECSLYSWCREQSQTIARLLNYSNWCRVSSRHGNGGGGEEGAARVEVGGGRWEVGGVFITSFINDVT